MSMIVHPGTSNVIIPTETVVLDGELSLPDHPRGIVLFVNGSGSGGIGTRNRRLAADLNQAGFATLLFDLRSHEERHRLTGPHAAIELADRLLSVTEWAELEPEVGDLAQGYFAAGVGAGAALLAAARAGQKIHALVCRGGRPDLAHDWLSEVLAPTLFLVGEHDLTVRNLNREAETQLRCPHRMVVVPGAGHNFEEPGSLESVSREATAWFSCHLAGARISG